MSGVALLCLFALPSVGQAQGEAHLRQYFLKCTVIARTDLPATPEGVDLHPVRVSDTKRVSDEALIPQGLMRILSDYIDFPEESFGTSW